MILFALIAAIGHRDEATGGNLITSARGDKIITSASDSLPLGVWAGGHGRPVPRGAIVPSVLMECLSGGTLLTGRRNGIGDRRLARPDFTRIYPMIRAQANDRVKKLVADGPEMPARLDQCRPG